MFSFHWQQISRRILMEFAIALLACSASIACAGTAWGSHGMAVFGGNEALYASHLPMFHAPHDYQVILRFHLQDATNNSALKEAIASKPELWTLDPEPFDLQTLAPGASRPLKQFSATLVQGHFERHGQPRFLKQRVIVDEVLLFRRLAPFATSKTAPSAGCYHLIGRGKEQFLVKEIDRRPDFDLILALPPRSATQAPLSAQLNGQITLPSPGLQAPSTDDWQKLLSTRPITLYFETDDLK
ncbi:MAG: hypothetical protein RL748_3149 [Pseudomonadota bacterium]|jgi:hypothetical protein